MAYKTQMNGMLHTNTKQQYTWILTAKSFFDVSLSIEFDGPKEVSFTLGVSLFFFVISKLPENIDSYIERNKYRLQ